jgi:C1A family cysteine protease
MSARSKEEFVPAAFGWVRDVPDLRDYSLEHRNVRKLLDSCAPVDDSEESLPDRVDLREYFLDVEDQGLLNASPAFACGSLIEYFQRRATGRATKLSKFFLYGTARRTQRVRGEDGIGIRATFKAIIRSGVPPIEYCEPNARSDEDLIRDPFLFSFRTDFSSLVYFRLDREMRMGADALGTIKAFLVAGFPCVLGFPVPSSLTMDAVIPYRPLLDAVQGGQAVVAVGFDDGLHSSCRGALLIRSSWGPAWGDHGYGWLPYGYLERGLVTDIWTAFARDWVTSCEFLRPIGWRLRLCPSEDFPAEDSPLAMTTTRPRPFHLPQSESVESAVRDSDL